MFKQVLDIPELDYKLTDKLNEKGLPRDSRVVDQFYSQDFMLGENGFPKSDVRMFLDTQSADLQMQIATRMQELKVQYPDQDLSNEEMIALTLDRNIQSAPDFQRWYAGLKDKKLEDYLNEQIAARQKAADPSSPDVIKFDEPKDE